ncbi:MAG TPA: D-aminoacyl-tRNA deacylase [Acidimicrobiia bacterium]
MRAVVQRVTRAAVTVDGKGIGAIGAGLLVLVGIGTEDGLSDVSALADKLLALRLFPDEHNRMNRAISLEEGAILVVSQFTLFGDLRRGNRPSFTGAAPAEAARPLVAALVDHLRAGGITVVDGQFGAHMEVELVNDGPVTLIIDVSQGRVI